MSALEGGYQLSGEHCSAFAKSVKSHVAALSSGGYAMPLYLSSDLEREETYERNLLDEIARKRQDRENALLPTKLTEDESAKFPVPEANFVDESKHAENATESSGKRRRSQVDSQIFLAIV